jgi:predicted enzyme related to lactoylglutathione lyase
MSAKPNGTFCWADLMPGDQDRAIAFYEGVFGWSVDKAGAEFGGYGRAYLDGDRVGGINPAMPGAPAQWLSYFATDDLDGTVATVKANGGSILELQPGQEIMDIPMTGRMAVAVDPTGAVFGLWQETGMAGFEQFGGPGSFCWTELYSTDAAKSRDFFAALFGYSRGTLSETSEFTYYQLTLPGNDDPTLGVMQDSAAEPSHFGSYIQVENADESAAKAVAAGATKGRGPEDTPFGRLVELTDSEGASIKLMGLNKGG